MLKGKKILLGITGSIAAYKAAFLIRELVKNKAEVKVIASASAFDFITPLTLSTLSKNPVYSEFTNGDKGVWNNHVELGLWADVFLIAPASANTIAKMASGICDNLLMATYLSAKCPVFVAPAMDLDMYQHPSFNENLKRIRSFGNAVIEAGTGELASGLYGQGRMEEPLEIVNFLVNSFKDKSVLKGKKVLITAGPTYEALDPVRFIGNHSSGKMGYALAENLAQKGALVNLVSGPTNELAVSGNISVHKVTSAREMFESANLFFSDSDIIIFAAAVADYTPATREIEKIKKTEETFNLKLVKTTDIAKELGKNKKPGQVLVGFALETNNEEQHAYQKLISKNLDLIILNSLNDPGAGFKLDTNKITIIDKDNAREQYPVKLKTEVAEDIASKILKILQ